MDARTTAGCTVKYDCNPTCPHGNHSKSGPPVGAAYMPPAHPATIANLTFRPPVGAGHVRPSALPLLQFNLPYCREGTCPSAAHCLYCLLLPPGRPCSRPPHLPIATPCTYHHPPPQYTPCPKIDLKICRKNQKQPLTRVILLAIIIKLSRGGHAAKSAS